MKKIITTLILITSLIFCITLSGCNKKREYNVLDMGEYVFHQHLSYGNDERNILDLFIPKNLSGNAGLILQIHGGGWVAGDKDGLVGSETRWLENGYVYSHINYRYADGYSVTASDILSDISSALLAIKQKCNEYGINLNGVGLYGGSAGGHLSLLYAYKMASNSPIKPCFVASYSGPTDLTDINYLEEKKNKDDVIDLISKISGAYQYKDNILDYSYLLKDASPVTYANSNCVPTLIFHGTNDDIVPYSNAVILDSVLTNYGVTHEFVTYKNSGHGLENDSESATLADQLLFDYANRYLTQTN